MDLEGKYKKLAESIKTVAGRQKIARSMVDPFFVMQIRANAYKETDEYKEELKKLKTMPRRNLGVCKKCECFSKAKALKRGFVLKGKYNCKNHSRAVVQEEMDEKEWTLNPIPVECLYYVEQCFEDWNGGKKNRDMP